MTIHEVKSRLIEYLGNMDLNKLSMMDLAGYTQIIGQLVMMEKPDPMAELARFTGYALSPKGLNKEEVL